MKKLLLGSVALIALGSAANAADLAARYNKAPAPIAAAYNWTGFYLSGGGGYGLWQADQQSTDAFNAGIGERTGGRGYFGTVGGGYDWQFAPKWVAGVFGDAQFGDLKGNFDVATHTATATIKNNLSYAAGVRLGYLIAPNALSYVNAGYSHADFNGGQLFYAPSGSDSGHAVSKMHRDGWFLGGGVENSLDLFGISAPGLFMKTEYRVAEYGRRNEAIGPLGGLAVTTSFKPYVQTVSTSLVYRFNSDGAPARVASAPLYTKAPAARVNWTGFYLSGGGGYGLWAADQQSTSAFSFPAGQVSPSSRTGGRGYFGTVSGGYDWQINPTWVIGVFGDAQFGDIKGTYNVQSITDVGTTKNNLSYAAGARLGYLVAPNVLSYVNGGYSHADFSSSVLTSATGGAVGYTIPKAHYDGWFLGGGVENSLDMFGISSPGWFMKTEYRVAEYNRKPADLVFGTTPSGTISFKPYVQTVQTSLVYRFNWGSPVVAKY
jgi:outer membrane immunogenic protein